VTCVPPGSPPGTIPRPEIWPNKTNPFDAPAPPPPPTGIVKCIDVSSNQGTTDLSAYIRDFGAQHVIVKLYQEVEGPTPEGWSIPQIHSALENGCTAGGYVWLYRGIDVQKQVEDALKVAQDAGIVLPILWIDCETYEKQGPSLQEIMDACYWSAFNGTRPGIYTGDWYWRDILGIPAGQAGPWQNYPCWFASYNGNADLDIHSNYWPDEMLVGHQYWADPIDESVMLESFTKAA
jgi:GH25 family lysozyme M1 (1,4-beta-N-acetylmuramidase)